MTTFSQKMQELRRILKLHANWLLYATVGESALTTLELAELREYGKLPMDSALDLVDKSYFLGRMRSTQKVSEYKKASKVVPATLNPVEEGTLEAARTKSLVRLKKIADDAMGTFVVDTTLVGNQKAIDVKKQAWSSAVRTEFQAAKIQGIANTIANRSDLYANSDGPESDVSVIPARQCCEDCREHYLDKDGNPKIFKLSELMASGSNADQGVIHTKTAGKHPYWKTTLPPLHPNCGCTLVYVPPGHAWVDGKLSLLNKSLFLEHISKATAGVRGPGLSGTVAPTGAPSLNKPAGHPSVPGAAAPGNVAGPGRPPGLSPKPGSGSGGPGGGPQYAPCPFGGGAECISHGGNGATMHKPGGSIMKKHQEAMARGAKPKTPQAIEAQRKQSEASAAEFNNRPNHQQVIHDHLSEGEIGSIRKLGGEDDAGQNASFKVSIVGNGSGIMKPHIDVESYLPNVYKNSPGKIANKTPEQLSKIADELACPGAGTMPKGMNPKSEAGTSGLANGLGLGSLYPTTVLRSHDGADGGPKGLTSVQHWKENAKSLEKYDAGGDGDFASVMKAVPKEHKDKVHEQFSTIAVMDMITNNGDRHFGNLMMDSENHDLIPIDHGVTFGNSLQGTRNDIAHQMHQNGHALIIPDKLHQKLKSASLDSTFRSMEESGLPDWSKAQTFLRQKYALHMQEKFGHIPYDRIRTTVTARNGELSPYMGGGEVMGWMDAGGIQGFFEAQAKNELPHQQFDSFAKTWMEERVNDPSHPEHQDAKRLFAMQPLRSSAHVTGREEATTEALSDHYSKIPKYDMSEPKAGSIKASMPASKKWEEKAPIRSAPSMPGPKTGAQTPKAKGAAASEPVGPKTGAQGPRAKAKAAASKPTSEIELDESDLEEIDPKKNISPAAFEGTGLQLDLSEYENDDDIDAAFDRIRTKSKIGKSLYLADPHAIFGLDKKMER
jgi:hypothetical protein